MHGCYTVKSSSQWLGTLPLKPLQMKNTLSKTSNIQSKIFPLLLCLYYLQCLKTHKNHAIGSPCQYQISNISKNKTETPWSFFLRFLLVPIFFDKKKNMPIQTLIKKKKTFAPMTFNPCWGHPSSQLKTFGRVEAPNAHSDCNTPSPPRV